MMHDNLAKIPANLPLFQCTNKYDVPCLLRVAAMSSASFKFSAFGSVHLILQGAVQLPGSLRMQIPASF